MVKRIKPENYFTPEVEIKEVKEEKIKEEIPTLNLPGLLNKEETKPINYFYKPVFNINKEKEERRIRPGYFFSRIITIVMDFRIRMLQVRRQFMENFLR